MLRAEVSIAPPAHLGPPQADPCPSLVRPRSKLAVYHAGRMWIENRMRRGRFPGCWLSALVALLACRGNPRPVASSNAASPVAAPTTPSAARPTDDDLVGVWKAKRRFGPDARGPLTLRREREGWTADFLGRLRPVHPERAELAFELPGGEGSFRGRLAADRQRVVGHWTPVPSVIHGVRFAVPVVLEADGADRWRGQVVPLDDAFTLYLVTAPRPDGTLGAFLRNPERNIGVRYDVDHLVRDGAAVRLVGRLGRSGAERTLLTGSYDAGSATLSIAFPERGGTYDFHREDEHSELYPHGKHPDRYVHQPPPALGDGWRTGTLDEVGISRTGIEAFIQRLLDMPIETVHTPEVDGVLVARHGKLVVEEYFHGESREPPPRHAIGGQEPDRDDRRRGDRGGRTAGAGDAGLRDDDRRAGSGRPRIRASGR